VSFSNHPAQGHWASYSEQQVLEHLDKQILVDRLFLSWTLNNSNGSCRLGKLPVIDLRCYDQLATKQPLRLMYSYSAVSSYMNRAFHGPDP